MWVWNFRILNRHIYRSSSRSNYFSSSLRTPSDSKQRISQPADGLIHGASCCLSRQTEMHNLNQMFEDSPYLIVVYTPPRL